MSNITISDVRKHYFGYPK